MPDSKTQPKDPISKLEQFLQANKFSVFLAVLGLIVLGIGVLSMKVLSPGDSQIEILTQESQESGEEGTILVDCAGAVQKPGVYELKSGSRVNDLLIMAGGLSAEADRGWVSHNMNLAQKLADGVKIFIPARNEISGGVANDQRDLSNLGSVAGTATGLININTASASQLDTLWGVGPATAEKIIAGRPYQKIEELQTKKIVKSNVWEAIKDKITVY